MTTNCESELKTLRLYASLLESDLEAAESKLAQVQGILSTCEEDQ